MSFSTKSIGIGLVLGLVIGLVIGYAAVPKGIDTTQLEQQISQLETQVSEFQSQISNKETTISNLESQITDKNTQIINLQSQLDDKSSQITSLQSQVSTLQSQVEDLEDLVPPLVKGEWNLVATFNGISEVTTDYFYVAGTELRINWTWSSNEEYTYFSISLYEKDKSLWIEWLTSLQKSGTTYVHNVKVANHYLEISESNLDNWTVTVEVFIEE